MYNYYCKNCNNIIGKWYDKYKYYDSLTFCYRINSKIINSIYFLDCINCNKFVGILCFTVCKNCFGEKPIIEEEILFNWFLKYKKTLNINDYYCKICDKNSFRCQYWFFKELTFYEKKI